MFHFLLTNCIGYFSFYCNKILDKCNFKEEEFILAHTLRIQCISAEEEWKKEHEALGGLVFSINIQGGTNASTPLIFVFYSIWGLSLQDSPIHI